MSKISIDINNIDKIIDALQVLYDDYKKMGETISKDIAEDGLKYLDKQYQNIYQDPSIGNITTKTQKTDDGYNIVASGKDVVYVEFGTGDKGENSPHPNKSEYNLNDYNSGTAILDVEDIGNKEMLSILAENQIVSGKFWSYTKGGKSYLTQGIPAGKQMFNTYNHLVNDSVKKIVKERSDEINDKFINSIKK